METDNQAMPAVMIQLLIKLAQMESCEDGYDVEEGEYYDPSDSGNFDDAFNAGHEAGQIYLARKVLNSLGISWADD